jgi:hypothetical protein
MGVLRVTVASFVALVLRFGNPRATKIASADAAQKGETEKAPRLLGLMRLVSAEKK